MSRLRRQPHPWLSDHVVFFCYRWLSWAAAGGLVFRQYGQGSLMSYGPLLVFTFCINLFATLVAQPYARASRRNPAILLLDIVTMVAVVLISDGARVPFLVYASSSLVMPGLLYGWRGGMMAGLAYVTLDLATNTFVGQPPDVIALQERGWTTLAAMMLAPPLFGVTFPWLLEGLRAAAERQGQRRQRPLSLVEPRLGGPPSSKSAERFTPRGLGGEEPRSRSQEQLAQPTRTVTMRAAEQGMDDTRQALFAPFPTPEIELPAALEQLASRFGHQTGLATRVTVLGRTRMLRQAQRTVLVRLAQEALLNVQQHAHARATELTLRYDSSSVALMVQDDGVGLLDGTHERPGLHALRAMHYRLVELGGRLDVFETEAGGVTVRATVPLE